MEIIKLTDAGSGTSARIAPQLGLNCFSFEVIAEGEPLQVLWSAPEFENGTQRPSSSGIPILFPFAGRLRGTRFEYDGKAYQVEAGDALGNAIHGFVFTRPWRVLEQSESSLCAEFQASVDDPSLRDAWPADFRVTAEYAVTAKQLSLKLQMQNPDQRPLPLALGLHPYFRLPIGGSEVDDCKITVPATKYWELVDMLPTGRILPATGARNLAACLPFSDARLDDVFTGCQFDHGVCTANIHDPGSGRTLQIRFGDVFSECVVYVPPHREAICIEPYTSVPNAFELEDQGHATGLRTLPPGETLDAVLEIELG